MSTEDFIPHRKNKLLLYGIHKALAETTEVRRCDPDFALDIVSHHIDARTADFSRIRRAVMDSEGWLPNEHGVIVAVWLTRQASAHANANGMRLLTWLANSGSAAGCLYLALAKLCAGPGTQDFEGANKLLARVVGMTCGDDILALAHCSYADSFHLGRGVAKSAELAQRHYEEAAACGSADGAYNAALHYEELAFHVGATPQGQSQVPQLLERAEFFYDLAIQHGSRPAQTKLGVLWASQRIPGKAEDGVRLLQSAAAEGDQEAVEMLRRLGLKLRSDARAARRAGEEASPELTFLETLRAQRTDGGPVGFVTRQRRLAADIARMRQALFGDAPPGDEDEDGARATLIEWIAKLRLKGLTDAQFEKVLSYMGTADQRAVLGTNLDLMVRGAPNIFGRLGHAAAAADAHRQEQGQDDAGCADQ